MRSSIRIFTEGGDTRGIEKVDVTHVTRRFNMMWLEKNAAAIAQMPYGRFIIDTSTPLGMARVRAISQVSAPYFVDVDDDVVLSRGWFVSMVQAWRNASDRPFLRYTVGRKEGSGRKYEYPVLAPVGAINCVRFVRGLGRRFDESLNRHVRRVPTHDLVPGERGSTGCTMFLTEAVRGWIPSVPDLSAFEDYEISQYVLKCGYRWIVLHAKGAECWHELTWKHVRDNAVWGSHGWKKSLCPTRFRIVREIVPVFLMPFVSLVQECDAYLFIFLLYQCAFRIAGLIW